MSICENIISINPNLTFLKGIISVSERMQSKAIKTAEDKINNVTVKVETKVEVKKVDDKSKEEEMGGLILFSNLPYEISFYIIKHSSTFWEY